MCKYYTEKLRKANSTQEIREYSVSPEIDTEQDADVDSSVEQAFLDGVNGVVFDWNVDSVAEKGYNSERGENYAATDEFRGLQEESKGMDDKQKQLFHSGDRQIDETLRERLSGILSRQVGAVCGRNGNANGLLRLNAKGNRFNIYENVDGNLFRDCFEIARNYLKNGELVDLHGVNTIDEGIGYEDCFNYLSEDGLSGFSITPDGDLISVFNASGKAGFLRAIAPIVKEKAKTLDCYASEKQNLMGMYEHAFGFKTASVMDYNMEYDHDNIAENHGKPQVAFMVNTDAEVETKHFTKDQYDEAKEYRDGFVKSESADSSESASFMPENESVMPDVSAADGETDSYEAFTKRYNGTLELTEDQKLIQSICTALGTEAVFKNLDRWATGKDGKRRFFSPDGYFDKATGKIYINTSTNGKHNPLLFVIKHELTHFGEINKTAYDSFVKAVKKSKEFKAWLEYKTGMKGETADRMAAKLGADIRDERSKYGVELGVAESEQEVIANFAGDILFAKSGKTLDSLLNSVEAKQRPKVIQAVVDFFRWLREKLSGNKDLTLKLQRLESKYTAMLKSVQKAAENTNSTGEGGQFSISSDKFSEYNKPITLDDIKLLRNIGRKSINEFTTDEIEVAQKWAYKFYQQLGTKSPFFRRWFGDWRAFDKGAAKIVSFAYGENGKINYSKRTIHSEELNAKILVDETIVNDSLSYAKKNGDEKQIRKLLGKVDEIIKNGILLDTQISVHSSGNKKGSTQFMHYLYTPISINGAPFIAKLSIEEYDLTGKNRAYNLQRIELSEVSRAQFSQLIEENRGKYAYTSDALSVSQLFKLVKNYDAEFKPKPVNEALIENGKSKVFYHGAKKNGGFTEYQ